MTAERIRWEPTGYDGWTGHVGEAKPWLFQIWKSFPGAKNWILSSVLPGQFGARDYDEDPEALKEPAEKWLAGFVSSLGAIFPPEHTEGPKRMAGRKLVQTCSCGKPWPHPEEG